MNSDFISFWKTVWKLALPVLNHTNIHQFGYIWRIKHIRGQKAKVKLALNIIGSVSSIDDDVVDDRDDTWLHQPRGRGCPGHPGPPQWDHQPQEKHQTEASQLGSG